MDIGKSFSFVMDDADWIKKIVIGGIIMLIPFVNFAGFGYMAELMRRVRDNDPTPLPDWDEFGKYFSDGLKLLVGFLIYSLPALLVICIMAIVSGGLVAAADSGGMDSDTISGAGIVMVAFQCVYFVLLLIPAVLSPAIYARFAEEGTIGSMIRFGDVLGFVKQNVGSYVIVLLVSFAVMMIIAPLGLIACLIGVIFTQWWAYLVFAHLTGQLMRSNELAV